MQLAFRGSVNSWECDENDHLNVRFYVEKHWQTLCAWLSAAGLDTGVTAANLHTHLHSQHLRFLQESRLATPLSGYAGVVGQDRHGLQVLTELRQSFTGDVLCACVHKLTGLSAEITDTLPQHACARGVPDSDHDYVMLGLDQVADYGFHPIGLGVAQPTECGPAGDLLVPNYMGRISDSMPHLWGEMSNSDDSAEFETDGGDEGGAVLEYRLRYHQPLRIHERFAVNSGIALVSAKVQRFAHLMFNADTGELCVSAEAAAVRMDLQARRALQLDPERQARLRQRQLKPLAG